LVEVSPGAETTEETVAAFMALLERIGKVPVKCAPTPGFIVPRIQAMVMNEVARMVDEGVATAEEIDRATRVGFGLRFAILGLVEFIDWGGLDILYYASRYMTEATGSDRFSSPPVVDRLMSEGKIGPKTGQGFYDYREMDVAAYQRETLGRLVGLLNHMGLVPPPGGVAEGAEGPAARTRTSLKS
jgi:3-hydroxybutyryl-CoA dehydrogenase